MIEKKSFAKVNIFLKITGTRENYHTLASRFMRVETLYDTLYFFAKSTNTFDIKGKFDCEVEQNTIYKAYKALLAYTCNEEIKKFFQSYGIEVEKNIPAFAGLGGGSSNAAAFLHMCNSVLGLELTTKELAQIGSGVGADVAFFVYDYASANVSGVGEVVEKFEEKPFEVEIFTPKIAISTPKVYRCYRECFFAPIQADKKERLFAAKSLEVLTSVTREEANDLYAPAEKLYPKLKEFAQEGWFFSGSGSSFFRLKENNG